MTQAPAEDTEKAGNPTRSTDLILRRSLLFFSVGALLSPLAGYFGFLVFGSAITVWLGGALFLLAADPKGALALLVMPAIYGFKWVWPVTLVILPALGLSMRQVTITKIPIFFVVGGLSGVLVVYLASTLGFMPLHTKNLEHFVWAGAFAGTVTGFLFGFIAWRIDYWTLGKGRERSS